MQDGQSHVQVRRVGRHTVVDLHGLASTTVAARVAALGAGWYQVLLVVCIGIVNFCESLEMGAVAPLHAALARVFSLSDSVRASLPAFTYGGSILGLALIGPIADKCGRRTCLFAAQFLEVVSMLMTAMLPAGTSPSFILFLRFINGAAGAAMGPPSCALAAESSPERVRTKVMFAIMFCGSVGYICEAAGVQWFMKGFGESESDNWRTFSWFLGIPALCGLPLIALLCESPAFLAVKGDGERVAKVLDTIAWYNGKPPLRRQVRVPQATPNQIRQPVQSSKKGGNIWKSLKIILTSFPLMVFILFVIEGSKTFLLSGSSYLWKDLFNMPAVSGAFSPTVMNLVASISPLVGLLAGNYVVMMFGIKGTMLSCSLVASTALVLLTLERLRSASSVLLALVLAVKLTYGPLSTCVVMMKLQAFPTEVRTTVFSLIGMFAKLLCLVAPTIVEVLRGGSLSSDWASARLDAFLWALIGATLACGLLSWFCGPPEDSAALEDYVDLKKVEDERHDNFSSKGMRLEAGRTSSYGSIYNIWGGYGSNPSAAREDTPASGGLGKGDATDPEVPSEREKT